MKSMPPYPQESIDRKQNDRWPCGRDTEDEGLLKRRHGAEGLSEAVILACRALVYSYDQTGRRQLPWRGNVSPWLVLVSEIMLQQTQVERVLPRFLDFRERFPTPRALADAALPDLLAAWQGLGYNRRALNLQRAARMIADTWHEEIPADPALLQQLPGIGPYTAGAVSTFAFNRPNVFLETNIRTVLLHLFFCDRRDVGDRELVPYAEALLDHDRPRDWYNALMDYGSDLKRRFPNPSRRSRHHTVQSRFAGSDRQLRGAILRACLHNSDMSPQTLHKQLDVERERLERIITALVQEGFLAQQDGRLVIPSV